MDGKLFASAAVDRRPTGHARRARAGGGAGAPGARRRAARGRPALARGRSPKPLLRGDELAARLAYPPVRAGEPLEELAAAEYAGELESREQALEYARRLTRS